MFNRSSARPALHRLALVLVCFGSVVPLSAQNRRVAAATSLKRLSLEALMDLEVTSVSRHAEKLLETPASVRVITGDDIRRSGAETLPQALRLASNLHAAQLATSYWTIGARGTNQTSGTSNKLLVMMDGRAIYSPLVSGTYWDQRDVFLPDIDHIEVISGPGPATWGANAVNGVINILTKRASATQGTLIYGGAGIEERLLAGLRYGGTLGSRGHYRVYAKHLDYDDTGRSDGTDARNRWVFSQMGFRTDTRHGAQTELTLSGDLYTGWSEQLTSSRGEFDGGNLQARAVTPFSSESTLTAQVYYDSARRGAPRTFGDRIDTVDFDVQHEWAPAGSRHRIVWGAGHRISADTVRNLPTQAFLPAAFTHRLTTAFVHDEIELIPRRLRFSLGVRYEHNNYSGSDFQPGVRLAWMPSFRHTIWTALSRAVRTPARVDRDFFIPVNPPFAAAGGPTFDSEVLHAGEVGWRGRVGDHTTAMVSVYLHDYTGLRTLEQPTPLQFANGLDGRTYGTELFVRQELTSNLEASLGYTLLKKDFTLKPWSRDFNAGKVEEADPEHQVHLRFSADLPAGFELDLGCRYVGAVPTLAARVQSDVPAYTELDAKLAWVSADGWEFALIGNSLLDRAHPETGPANNRREIQRSVHGRVTWRF